MTPSRFPTDAPLCIDPALLMAPPSPISSAPFQQSNTYRASTGTPIVDDTYDSAASNLATPSSSNVYQSARSAPSTFSKHTSDIDDPFGLVASNLVEPSTSNEYSSITHEPYTFNTTSFTGNSYIGSPFNLSAGGLLEPSNNNGYPSMTKNAYTLGTHDFTGISNIGSLFDPRAGNLLEHSTSNMYSPMTNDPSTLGTYAFTGNSCVDNPLDLYASRSWEPSMGNAYSSMTNNSHNLATNHSPLLYKSTASNSVSDIEQFLTYNDETISYDGSSPATTIDVHQFQVSSFREHIARILARRQREHDHQTARIEGQGHQNPEQHKLLHDSEPGTCELTNPAQVHGEYEELNTPNKEQIFQDPSQHSDHHGNRSKGRKPRKKASKPSASSRKRKNRSNDDQQSPSKKAKEAPEPLVKSKLSLKRDIMANKYGEDRVTKLATVKGEIRHNVDGSIDYWCSLEMRWRPAVYHDDIRDELIKLDEVDQPEAYAAAPAAGGHKLDITSNVSRLTRDLSVKLHDANMAAS